VTIWRRDQTVFTTSGDSRERALGPGRNPTLVAARAGPFGAWTRGTSLVVWKPGATEPETVDEDGAFPSAAALSDGSVAVAWESKGATLIRTIR